MGNTGSIEKNTREAIKVRIVDKIELLKEQQKYSESSTIKDLVLLLSADLQ